MLVLVELHVERYLMRNKTFKSELSNDRTVRKGGCGRSGREN